MKIYQLDKDGERVNDIICEPEFVEWYAAQHGYTYHEVEAPAPTIPEEVPAPGPGPIDEVTRLRAQVTMLLEQQTFLEDCLLEMAEEVYA